MGVLFSGCCLGSTVHGILALFFIKVMIMRRAIILLALFSVSCSSVPGLKPYRMDVQQGNVVNSKMMAQLRPGMTKSQVRFILGTPLIQDSFHKDRWDYFYQMRKGGAVVEQRRVILDFENDVLKGVRGDVIPATPDTEAKDKDATVAPKAEEKKGFVFHCMNIGDSRLPGWADSKKIPSREREGISLTLKTTNMNSC